MTANTAEIEVTFLPADDDPRLFDPAIQAELWKTTNHFDGLKPAVRMQYHDAVDASVFNLGQVTIALGVPVITALGTAAGFWIQGRIGRKVKLKFGDTEIEAGSVDEVKQLLALAADMKPKTEPPIPLQP